MESSEPRLKGDRAVLVGPVISGFVCLKFKYHMYGQHTGALAVYQHGSGVLRHRLWMRQGNMGNLWRDAYINIDCREPHYQVNGKSERGGGVALLRPELPWNQGMKGRDSASALSSRHLWGLGFDPLNRHHMWVEFDSSSFLWFSFVCKTYHVKFQLYVNLWIRWLSSAQRFLQGIDGWMVLRSLM